MKKTGLGSLLPRKSSTMTRPSTKTEGDLETMPQEIEFGNPSQYIRIRSFTWKNYIRSPLRKRLIPRKDTHRLEKSYLIEVFTSVDNQRIGKIRIDDLLWFLTEYNSYPLKEARSLLDKLHATELERFDIPPTCAASDWTLIDAPIGYSNIFFTFLTRASKIGLDPSLYCFGNPQQLQQYVLTYQKGLSGRRLRRPWMVAWHHERAELTKKMHFRDEESACNYLFQQVSREDEFRKRYSPRTP